MKTSVIVACAIVRSEAIETMPAQEALI